MLAGDEDGLNLSLDRRKCWAEVVSDSNTIEPDEGNDQPPET